MDPISILNVTSTNKPQSRLQLTLCSIRETLNAGLSALQYLDDVYHRRYAAVEPTIEGPIYFSMLTTDLKEHLALITGATGGIGRATCHALASLNCSIAIHYHSASSIAESLVTALKAKGIRAEAFQADLRQYDGVRELHRNVVETMGHPTILFNNAGIAMKSGIKDIQDVSVEMFEETWRTNCGSAFLLTQLCLPEMEKQGCGRIIFCSSVAGFTGGVVGPHYA